MYIKMAQFTFWGPMGQDAHETLWSLPSYVTKALAGRAVAPGQKRQMAVPGFQGPSRREALSGISAYVSSLSPQRTGPDHSSAPPEAGGRDEEETGRTGGGAEGDRMRQYVVFNRKD